MITSRRRSRGWTPPERAAPRAGETAAVEQALRVGPLARAAAEIDDATREKVREAVRGVMGRYATADGITPPAACWLVGAVA